MNNNRSSIVDKRPLVLVMHRLEWRNVKFLWKRLRTADSTVDHITKPFIPRGVGNLSNHGFKAMFSIKAIRKRYRIKNKTTKARLRQQIDFTLRLETARRLNFINNYVPHAASSPKIIRAAQAQPGPSGPTDNSMP